MPNLTYLRTLLEHSLSKYCYSGYQLYFELGEEKTSLYGGKTSYWPQSKLVTENSLFDLGSVTKVVLTTSVIARLVEQNKIQLEKPVKFYVPKLSDNPIGAITIDRILSHAAGLIDWMPYFKSSEKGLLEWLVLESKSIVVAKPDTSIVYSDIGFMILGLIIESVGESLESQFNQLVRLPMGMKCMFNPMSNSLAQPSPETIAKDVAAEDVAATEYCLWRKRLIQGAVFDENCAAMGGIGPHAGLFSSAQDLSSFARTWLSSVKTGTPWLKRETALKFTQRTGYVKNSDRALGWDMPSNSNSSAGDYFSKKSFGHLGFTGTSLWIDPEINGFCIFLTNRIHPSRHDIRIRELRPLIHNEIYQIWRSLDVS